MATWPFFMLLLIVTDHKICPEYSLPSCTCGRRWKTCPKNLFIAIKSSHDQAFLDNKLYAIIDDRSISRNRNTLSKILLRKKRSNFEFYGSQCCCQITAKVGTCSVFDENLNFLLICFCSCSSAWQNHLTHVVVVIVERQLATRRSLFLDNKRACWSNILVFHPARCSTMNRP